jgi:hypothetical protein
MLPLTLYVLKVTKHSVVCSFTSHVREEGKGGGAVVSPPWVTESKGHQIHVINENYWPSTLSGLWIIQPSTKKFDEQIFFLKFIISVRGRHCDYLLRAPVKPSYATERNQVTPERNVAEYYYNNW